MSESTDTVKNYSIKIASISANKLYLDAETADVNFIIESNEEILHSIPAHKNLLAAASDVFKAMFYGELKEKSDVKITGVSAASFEEFLQFFYLNEVKLTLDNIADVMGLGHKYNVDECFDVCIQFLKETLSAQNACLGYGLAILYDQVELIDLCEQEIIMNTDEVFQSKYFLETERGILNNILNMEMLSCSELKVFEACMAWARTASNENDLTKEIIETELGNLFNQIRFKSMTIDEFREMYRSYEHLFPPAEFIEITKMIIFPEYSTNVFNNDLRQIHWDENTTVKCNRIISDEIKYKYTDIDLETGEKTTFSTNRLVRLEKFTCATVYISRDGKPQELQSKLPIEITILEIPGQMCSPGAVSKKIDSFKSNLECKNETVISLPNPVLVKPEFKYEIRIKTTPENHYFKYQYLQPAVLIDTDTVIKFYEDRKHEGHLLSLITAMEFNTKNKMLSITE